MPVKVQYEEIKRMQRLYVIDLWFIQTLQVGDHEVECNPNFRLFLHTASLPQDIPPELAAYTTLIYNQTTRNGIKTELLDRYSYYGDW